MNFVMQVFGIIGEETPDHRVIAQRDGYEIWRYPSQVSAVVNAKDLFPSEELPVDDDKFASEAFQTLARYIGVFSKPENDSKTSGTTTATKAVDKVDDNEDGEKNAASDRKPEKISMTAPVVMTNSASNDHSKHPEKVSMTAPVVMKSADGASGKGGAEQSMRFFLPSKYRTIEEAPAPTNPVVNLELVEDGRYEAVMQFSGGSGMKRAPEQAKKLKELLDKDQAKTVGDWSFHGYNPPFSLPWLRRNEIHFPVDPASFIEEPADASADRDN